MSPTVWVEWPFKITSLGGRNATYYLFCAGTYLKSSQSLEQLQEHAKTVDIEALPPRIVPQQEPSPPRVERRRRTRVPPPITGIFTMIDDTENTPTTQEAEVPATQTNGTAKKRAAPKKKAAAAKKTAAPRAARKNAIPEDAVFRVDLGKTDRKEGSKGYAHLKKLDGKTYGQVKKTEWYKHYLLKRDRELGALKIEK